MMFFQRLWTVAAVFVAASVVTGCVTCFGLDEGLETVAAVQPATFGGTAVKTHKNMYFSGQPDEQAFKAAANSQVALVINLREKVEMKGNDAMLARQAGLPYMNIPVSGRGPFEREAFERISAAVEHAKGPVWVYCASGNRAGAWYASHLILKEKVDQDQALQIGQDTGMTRPEMQDRVLDYVNQQ